MHNYVDKELVISDKLYQFYEIKSLKENDTITEVCGKIPESVTKIWSFVEDNILL